MTVVRDYIEYFRELDYDRLFDGECMRDRTGGRLMPADDDDHVKILKEDKSMYEERVREVFGDEEFVKSLFELETPAEVCAAVKEKGIDLTEGDVLKIRDMLIRQADGELTDEELENVAGGSALGAIVSLVILSAALVYVAIKTRW